MDVGVEKESLGGRFEIPHHEAHAFDGSNRRQAERLPPPWETLLALLLFPSSTPPFSGEIWCKDGGQGLAPSLGRSRCAGLVLGCQDVIACPVLECLTLVEAFRCRSLTFHPRHWGKPCLVWKRTEIAFWALSVVCIICQEVYLSNV